MSAPFDPLCRIFGNAYAPIAGIQGPGCPRTEGVPHFEVDEKGFSTPKNFDNDICIKMYEETLKMFTDQDGMKHPGVQATAEGLARLYELKAGVEKDAQYYDKAIEYLTYANSARRTQMGSAAEGDPKYIEAENRIAKVSRKKDRRLAKGAAAEESALVSSPSSRVVEVLLLASGLLLFRFEDTSQTSFRLPGASKNLQASMLDQIDDDLNESYSAPPFVLQPDEFLVGMITHEKQQQGELNAMAFHTSSGRRSHTFKFANAEPLGREFSYWAAKDSHIVGLKEVRGQISIPLQITEGFR
jgi:hypothetical protein